MPSARSSTSLVSILAALSWAASARTLLRSASNDAGVVAATAAAALAASSLALLLMP